MINLGLRSLVVRLSRRAHKKIPDGRGKNRKKSEPHVLFAYVNFMVTWTHFLNRVGFLKMIKRIYFLAT